MQQNGKRRRVYGLAMIALGLLLVSGAALWVTTHRSRGADPDNIQQVALGRSVYVEHCAACHGARLEGQANWPSRKPDGRMPAPPHDASGHTRHHPDEVLFGITKEGLAPFAPPGYQSDMPGFAGTLRDE
jgi:mono/diheme cytochrome c family protein